VHRVATFAKREKLFRGTSRVLAAVSGGPDSVALLLILLELREQFGFEVVVCHFDHQLRPSSAEDLAFVRALCERLGVECFTAEGDVRGVARDQRKGIEETARRMRYQFLAFVAGKERADCIATGHTADDQAETVLMRIIRGSGVRGIRGMLPVSGVPGSEAQRLVRPILGLRRDETHAICAEAGIEPLVDASNEDVLFARNRVRRETLPALRAFNPSIESALIGLAESAREVFAGVERQALGLAPLERGPAGAIFPLDRVVALASEALTLLVEREASFYGLLTEVNRTRVQNLRSVLLRGAGQVRFGGCAVEVSSGKVRIGPPLLEVEGFASRVLNVPGVTVAGPWRITVTTDPLPVTPGTLAAAVDTSRVRGALRARPLVAGDRMDYHGMIRKVSDVLSNAKVPAWERLGMVALADSSLVVALFRSTGAIAGPVTGDDVLYVSIARLVPAGESRPGH
jgi:tRNA(Ile)-lysidine synthase